MNGRHGDKTMRRNSKAIAAMCFSILVSSAMVAAQTATGSTVSTGLQATNSSRIIGVRARLEKGLNAKKAKEGDVIEASPEAKIHLADGLDLDSRSRLLGHIDKVQSSREGSDSAISITFDKMRMNDGQEVRVKATILWIGEAPNVLNPTVVSEPADRTTPGVGVGAGMSQVPPSQGYQGSEITGVPARNGKRSIGGLAPQLPAGVSIQMDAIPGVNFFSDMSRADSGWFRSQKKNVSVPSGTVMAFAMVVLPNSGGKP
jgi:hypothetical protein